MTAIAASEEELMLITEESELNLASDEMTRSKSRGRPTCFYCGKPGHFQKNCRHFRRDKETDDTDSKRTVDRNGKGQRGPHRKGTTTIVASEEELLFITEESELNLVDDEIDLGS